MLNVYSPKSISKYYLLNNLKIKKHFGQNFLIDKNICRKIIQLLNIQNNDTCLEIGAGLGNLSYLLCEYEKLNSIYLVEKDRDFSNQLMQLKKKFPKKVQVFLTDFLDLDLSKLPNKIKVIGNLPYNVATHFLCRFLDEKKLFNMTFTLQSEVAERICANTYSKKYGYLSVLCQCFFECKHHFYITPNNFFPRPNVSSSVIQMIPKPLIKLSENDLYSNLKKILNCVFSQRRKMLKVSMKNIINNSERFLSNINIEYTKRPEEITPNNFIKIAKYYTNNLNTFSCL